MTSEKVLELLISSAATLTAAFAGAWAAFKLQRAHESGKQRAAEVEQCNRMLLILMQQVNVVMVYRRQILDPFRDNPARHFTMPPVGHLDYSHLYANAAALSFLLQTGAAELPQMVAIANDRFHRFVAAANDRAARHREFQEALDASSADMKTGVPLSQVEDAVGLRICMTMQTCTDGLFQIAASIEASLHSLGRDMPKVLKQVYKHEKIIGFSPNPAIDGAPLEPPSGRVP